jgi:hypothetical protein
MKVKLFWRNNPLGGTSPEKNARALEDEINAWLSENPRIRIIDIRQSASDGGVFVATLWLISVWYEEAAA